MSPNFEAKIKLLPTHENGRIRSILSGYRPGIQFDGWDYLTSSYMTFLGEVFPGEEYEAGVSILSVDYFTGKLYDGKKFWVLEGKRVVGVGTVTKVITQSLIRYMPTISDLDEPTATFELIYSNRYMFMVNPEPAGGWSVKTKEYEIGGAGELLATNDPYPSIKLPLLPPIIYTPMQWANQYYEKQKKENSPLIKNGDGSAGVSYLFGLVEGYTEAAAKEWTTDDILKIIKLIHEKNLHPVINKNEINELLDAQKPWPIKVEVMMNYEFQDQPDPQQWEKMTRKEKNEYIILTTPKVVDGFVDVKRWIYPATN